MVKSNKFLLDTHIFIWWLQADIRLSKQVNRILTDTENTIYLSVASIWEMYIKIEKGKLKMPYKFEDVIAKTGFTILPIALTHVLQLNKQEKFHKDPFDLMLVAQAKAEKLTLISSDEKFQQYKVTLLI